MNSKNYRILAVVIILLMAAGLLIYLNQSVLDQVVEVEPAPPLMTSPRTIPEVTNYEECVNTGGVVLASLPSKCRAASGQTFTNPAGIFGRQVYEYDCTETEEIIEDGKTEKVVVCK